MPFDFDADPLSLSGLFPTTTAPVQLDVYGYCQMACYYCFANLNKASKGRKLNLVNSAPALFRSLTRAVEDDESLIGWLLRERYFAALSNTTDPFQREEKTHRASEAVLAWAKAQGQPLFLETKGNVLLEEWDRYAPLLVPDRTVVYVSLTTLDPRIARRYEPGAMRPESRLELMRRLVDLGCGVIAACNPYVPEWVPDLDAYCEAVRGTGATDVFPFHLHFTEKQAAQIPKFYREDVEAANPMPAVEAHHFRAWQQATARAGLHCGLTSAWDSRSSYSSSLLDSPALRGRGRQVLWLHDFCRTLRDYSDANDRLPVLFSWRTIQKFLAERGVDNPRIKTQTLDACWMNSSEGHREFWTALGKVNTLWECLRWQYNNPWHRMRGVWSDWHVLAMYNAKEEWYERDRNGDLVGAWHPKAPKGLLRIDYSQLGEWVPMPD